MTSQKLIIVLALAAVFLPLRDSRASGKAQQTFDSPEAAVSTLVSAVEKDDIEGLTSIFGPGSDDLLQSGDKVQDKRGRQTFLRLYTEQHSLDTKPHGTSLVIGKELWPFPVPLVQKNGQWFFDLDEGEQEIINRRVGENELRAIEFCHQYVDAQKVYSSKDRDGDGFQEYAKSFMSPRGTRNGLFWFHGPGESPSPLGPVAASAFAEGYLRDLGKPQPFHGYYFRILTAQGPHAPGGEKNYISYGGRMTEGFAMVAYPAKWDVSGVMTFMVDQGGKVFEKNLGPQTVKIASSMKSFDPGEGWKESEPPL